MTIGSAPFSEPLIFADALESALLFYDDTINGDAILMTPYSPKQMRFHLLDDNLVAPNPMARNPDESLGEVGRGIQRTLKHNNIAAGQEYRSTREPISAKRDALTGDIKFNLHRRTLEALWLPAVDSRPRSRQLQADYPLPPLSAPADNAAMKFQFGDERRRSSMLRLMMTTIVVLVFLGCRPSSVGMSSRDAGCLLGHDSGGVAIIALSNGTKTYIRPREEGHLWWGPVWCPSIARIACVDTYKAVSLIAVGSGTPEILFPIKNGRRVDSLAVTPKGQLIFVDGHNSGESRLVALDLSTRKHRVISEGNFDGNLIQAIGDERAIIRKRTRPNDDAPWSEHVVAVDLETGKEIELAKLTIYDWFAASPSGKWLLVASPESFRLYDTKSGAAHEISSVGLPGKNGGQDGCFISEDELVLFREYDTWRPIGFFRLNARTGESTKVTGESVWHPSYLREIPALK